MHKRSPPWRASARLVPSNRPKEVPEVERRLEDTRRAAEAEGTSQPEPRANLQLANASSTGSS